jgi:hypothetical protein
MGHDEQIPLRYLLERKVAVENARMRKVFALARIALAVATAVEFVSGLAIGTPRFVRQQRRRLKFPLLEGNICANSSPLPFSRSRFLAGS